MASGRMYGIGGRTGWKRATYWPDRLMSCQKEDIMKLFNWSIQANAIARSSV